MPLMEDWNIPCRLTSTRGYIGCFEGYVTDLEGWMGVDLIGPTGGHIMLSTEVPGTAFAAS